MRNKRAETFGLPRELIPYYSTPYDYSDSEDSEDWWYDGDEFDYDWETYREKLVPNITSTFREAIVFTLSNLRVNEKTSSLFEDIIVGPFVIVVETRSLLESYVLGDITTYKSMSLHVSEFSEIEKLFSEKCFDLSEDPRFCMKSWASKFTMNVAKDFTFDDLIDLIRLCKRLDKLHTFF